MHLTSEETQLVGAWRLIDGKMQADENAQRIGWLLQYQLRSVVAEQNGWRQLYQNPTDSCYWELSFPQGHLQGGGPPTLTRLKPEEVSGSIERVVK